MDRERALHADAERDLPHGERLLETAALTADHDPLEYLDALAPRLDDPDVHLNAVAGPERGQVRAQIGLVDEVGVLHGTFLLAGGGTIAEAGCS